jgi:hypothetical protein
MRERAAGQHPEGDAVKRSLEPHERALPDRPGQRATSGGPDDDIDVILAEFISCQ